MPTNDLLECCIEGTIVWKCIEKFQLSSKLDGEAWRPPKNLDTAFSLWLVGV